MSITQLICGSIKVYDTLGTIVEPKNKYTIIVSQTTFPVKRLDVKCASRLYDKGIRLIIAPNFKSAFMEDMEDNRLDLILRSHPEYIFKENFGNNLFGEFYKSSNFFYYHIDGNLHQITVSGPLQETSGKIISINSIKSKV